MTKIQDHFICKFFDTNDSKFNRPSKQRDKILNQYRSFIKFLADRILDNSINTK